MRSEVSIILFLASLQAVEAWTPSSAVPRLGVSRCSRVAPRQHLSHIFMSSKNEEGDDIVRTSFDDAGRSIIEEEDQKRIEDMGDFDSTGAQADSVERMRAAIRERTAGLGMEKSKVSADYIAKKQDAALNAGPPGGQTDADSFGGLDLSQISDTKLKNSGSDWNDEMPSMFYDAGAELTKDEQEEADPLMLKNFVDQALYEISQAKWPTPPAALREVGLMVIVIAFSTVLIVGWDRLLRDIYTNIGFIPSKEDLVNYASRFDGLELPDGWMNGMNEDDVQKFSETVNTVLPDL